MMTRVLLLTLFLFIAVPAQAKILDIQEVKTPKGITIWMVEDHSLPVIALSFAFRGGSTQDPAGKMGVSQVLSNTLDEGAGELTSEKFQATLRDQAIDLSFDSDRDAFSGSVRTLTRHKDTAFNLLKLAVNHPRFDAEPVGRMKDANLVRIRSSMDDGEWINARILNDRIYAGHPYAHNSGGTLVSIAGITPQDLRDIRAKHFAKDRLVIGLAGDISKEDASRIIDDIFGTLPDTVKTAEIGLSALPEAGKPVFYAKAMPQTQLAMAWPGIGIHDPDYYAASVMNYIFGGGGFSSMLMTEVREARGLTYGIYSWPTNLDYADRFVVQASMLPQNVKPTIDVVKTIAAAMKDKDVSADALKAAQDYLTGSLPLSFASSSNIAGTLTSLQLNARPITALDDYRAKIMAITPADIRRAAARIFAVEPVIVTTGAKPDNLDVETITTIPEAEGK